MSADMSHDLKLTPNIPRILAAIHRVISLGQRRGRPVSQYDIVKSLFLADRLHLNEWGRPITYDNYVAMKYGPVPSLAYDLLKGNEFAMRQHGIDNLPWKSSIVPGRGGMRHYTINEAELDEERYLSESDLDALNYGLDTVTRLGFGQIKRLTHQDPAYLDAWRGDDEGGAYDMKFALLFEEPNFDRAEVIAEQSAHV